MNNSASKGYQLQKYPFYTTLTVQIGDVNYGGHAGNDKYLLFFHEARLRYFQELGISEGDIGEGVSLTQVEAYVSYKNEAFYGDELVIGVRIDEISRARFKVEYFVTRKNDNATISAGYTVLAGFDYREHRLKRIPTSFIDKVTTRQEK